MPAAKRAVPPQPLQKLSPQDLNHHLNTLKSMVDNHPKDLPPLQPSQIRHHLEPLLKHYFLAYPLIQTAQVIQIETGYHCRDIGNIVTRWNITRPGQRSNSPSNRGPRRKLRYRTFNQRI